MKDDWMKCNACGHGTDIRPNEPFIKILISGGGDIPAGFIKYPSGATELYACPRCGTVKIKV